MTVRYHTALDELMVDKEAVTPDPLNANNGDVDEIITSIEINGCYRPVYASRETKHIVSGHHLYAALLEMGAHHIPVIWLDGDDAAARRILVADNQIARLARMDDTRLYYLLEGLRESEVGLLGTGFNDDSLERLAISATGGGSDFWGPQPGPDLPRDHKCPECGHEWTD